MAQWIEHRIPGPRVGGSSPFRRTNKKERAKALSFLLASLTGWTRKGGISGHTGAKSVRWTLFSPWESPSAFSCIRYGCKWKLNLWSFCMSERKGLEQLNATVLWTVAADGSTEAILYFCPNWAEMQTTSARRRCASEQPRKARLLASRSPFWRFKNLLQDN